MTRTPIALSVLAGMLALIAADLMNSAPLNPYKAPPMLAFGSGLAATGAHCAAPVVE